MPRALHRLCRLIPLVALVATGSGWAADARTTPAPAAARLHVDNPSHDFGRVQEGSIQTHTFRLKNTGTETLQFLDVRPACGCTTVDPAPDSLSPGAVGELRARLDTARFSGPLVKTIALHTNDPTEPHRVLELKAQVWAPLAVAHPVLMFPALKNADQPSVRATTIRNESGTAVSFSTPESDNPAFRARLEETPDAKEHRLTVELTPGLSAGAYSGRITVKTSLPAAPTLTVQAVATVLAALQIAPESMVVPAAALRAAERRFAVLICHRGPALEVSDLVTDAPGVTLTTTTTPDGRQVTIVVTFPEGFHSGAGQTYALRGKTNHPEKPTFEIPIRVSAAQD